MEIAAPVDQDQHPPGLHHPEGLAAHRRGLVDPEPEHVHRRANLDQRQPGFLAQHRAAAVGGDHQPRGESLARGELDPADPAAIVERDAGGLARHAQLEARDVRALAREEIEQVPLRHHRDVGRGEIEVAEARDLAISAGYPEPDLVDPAVRDFEQLVEPAELVEQLHRRGVDRVAAEIAEEVGVLFEHHHSCTGARQEHARHHPGGAATDHDSIGDCVAHAASRIKR